jgi:RNA polymerase sigma-70 factor (ECF subfamily)
MSTPLEHLFRREAGRLVASLTRVFGVANLALAEDVVQDALCRALETWSIRGVPDDPAAWLMTTAKNRALDLLRRERTARTFAPELAWQAGSEEELRAGLEELAAGASIADDQLRMMFSCCNPRLTEESQVALVLHILCGFSVSEIAGAFLSRDETVKKRITRAKALLAGSRQLFDLSDADFAERLSSVQRALYLLFSEGFHGASAESAVRSELCAEAMRLTALLCAHHATATPASFALGALMWLHAARLPSRLDAAGELTQLDEQDRSRWDPHLMAEGQRMLDASATGDELTAYHVEAAIAATHASARDAASTPWPAIVSLYDVLLRLRPSPVVALNRALAIAQRDGAARGLEELRAIADRDRLVGWPFYAAALGELELRSGNAEAARAHFREALALARNPTERRCLERRLADCGADGPEKPGAR